MCVNEVTSNKDQYYVGDVRLDIDIFVDCNWVNTRWQWYSTHDQYIG